MSKRRRPTTVHRVSILQLSEINPTPNKNINIIIMNHSLFRFPLKSCLCYFLRKFHDFLLSLVGSLGSVRILKNFYSLYKNQFNFNTLWRGCLYLISFMIFLKKFVLFLLGSTFLSLHVLISRYLFHCIPIEISLRLNDFVSIVTQKFYVS